VQRHKTGILAEHAAAPVPPVSEPPGAAAPAPQG
ncbi:MAG: hypothetical protein QOG77_2149, partial [Solirubrobacteraceae bacterium]|nr:hypothetical protein [Solirubrobacteraceae bacterium]